MQAGGCGTWIAGVLLGLLFVNSGKPGIVELGAGILFFFIGIPLLIMGGFALSASRKRMEERAKEEAIRRLARKSAEEQRQIAETRLAREPGRSELKQEVMRRALEEFASKGAPSLSHDNRDDEPKG